MDARSSIALPYRLRRMRRLPVAIGPMVLLFALFGDAAAGGPREPFALPPLPAPQPAGDDVAVLLGSSPFLREEPVAESPGAEDKDSWSRPQPSQQNRAAEQESAAEPNGAERLGRQPRPLAPPRAATRIESSAADRLEWSAAEARSDVALQNLEARCRDALEHETLSDRDRGRVRRLAGWACDSLGRRRAAAGDRSGALADFEEALRWDPDSLAARHDRAVSLAESGRVGEALSELDRVLEARPGWFAARRNRAAARLNAEDASGALADCDAALAAATDGAPVASIRALRAASLAGLGRLREAVAEFDRALAEDPDDPRLLAQRGHARARLGDDRRAAEDYTAAAWKDPSSVEAYRSLAWVLATTQDASLRDPVTAVEAAWRARRLSPRPDPLVLEASAAAFAAAGQWSEAVAIQRQAVATARKAPGDAGAAGARLALYEQRRSYVAPAAYEAR